MLPALGGLVIIGIHILEFTPDVPLESGGGGMMRHITGLASFLRIEGHEVTIVSARAAASAPLPAGMVRARGLGVLPLIRRADVVHVHGGRMVEVALTACLAWVARKPFLYTPHAYYDTPLPRGTTTGQRARQWLRTARKVAWDQVVERALLRRGFRTIVLAPFWVDYLRARHLPVGRVAVIPNAVDLSVLEVLPRMPGTLPGSPALLTVGRLDEVKQVEVIIRALVVPGMEQAHLHVVGTGPDLGRLQGGAFRGGVAERVTWHGFVDDHRVAKMTASADAFVIASRQEGLPTTVLESLVRGTPVVASDIPPHRHILGVAGEQTLYRLGDVTDLARAAQMAAGRTVDDAARERVRVAFSWQTNAGRILALYEEAVA